MLQRLVNPMRDVSDETLRRGVGGRAIVVTGASHGIGRATATRLAAAGAEVHLVARSADVLEGLAAGLGPAAHVHACDLTDPVQVAELVTALTTQPTPIEVVVSNAGHSIRRSIAESYERMHDFERTIALNYLGPVQLLLGLLPAMRERGSGHVVNVSTIGLLVPPAPRWSAYVSSKAAFDTWLRSVAAETGRDGVTATSIYMTLVHTRMSAPTSDFDRVPGLTPDEAAGIVCHAIVERPAAIAPWWGSAAGAFSELARRPSEQLMRRYGRRIEART